VKINPGKIRASKSRGLSRKPPLLFLWMSLSLPALAQSAAQTAGTTSEGMTKQTILQREPSSIAEHYVSETEGLAVPELLKVMLARNKGLEGVRTQQRQADARLAQARLRPNPTFDIEHADDALFANEGERRSSLSLSQPFELGGKRRKRIQVAQAFAELTKAQIAEVERQLTTQVWTLFGQAVAAAAQLEQLEQIGRLNQQMMRVMETRLAAGDASKLDQRLLQVTTNQFEAQRLQAENQLSALLLQIKTLIGFSPQDPLVLRKVPPPEDIGISEQTALEMALERRPDLRAAKVREAMAESEIELAKSEAFPNISASVRYTPERNIIEGLLKPEERIVDRDKLLSFGISIPLPVFNRQQGNIAEAASLRARARSERMSLEQAVRRDVLLAYQRYQAARRSLEVFTGNVLPESRESFQIVQLAHRLGELRLLDVINQERLFIEAQMSYVAAQKDYFTALADLEGAIGRNIATLEP
jgi:cobalt-zinc-cadmium efflux system outer membrane protein